MVGLIDIAPRVEYVEIDGARHPVYGVSARGIAHLLGRFPELRMLMSGRDVGVEQIMKMGGDAVAAIIAAGCGYPGDEEQERAADRFAIDLQADFIAPILRLTLPKGVGPFVEKLTALGSSLGAAVDPSSMVLGSTSPKRSTNSSGHTTPMSGA